MTDPREDKSIALCHRPGGDFDPKFPLRLYMAACFYRIRLFFFPLLPLLLSSNKQFFLLLLLLLKVPLIFPSRRHN